uniref:Uncharacterized protein n=1 Tax=Skeletonema marinoi TaxID=267567 RepID=A0A7S2Q3L9_9STRA|mmetsp:Transcript_9008/g.15337  ORF Transcript_9008/g.15337 Transcript_9008/m.15337 type:complete len:335 (+) Transcript_9008:67-1071(+)
MATDPLVARHLNTLGLSCHGHDDAEALQYHRDALQILEWNKCNALLFEKMDLSREYALEMAITQSNIGDAMRRGNDFVGAAEAYKECLDLFLEGLIDNGIMLKTKLNEIEQQQGCDGGSYATVIDDVDFDAVGKTLHEHADYARIVAGVNTLLREIQCAKFVSHSASSRRRRRMSKLRATEENLKKAVESLSMASETTPMKRISLTKQAKPSLKRSVSMPDYGPTRPSLLRRSVTSIDDNQDKYDGISARIAPAENALVIALKRFPAPKIVSGDPSHSNDRDATLGAGKQVKTPSRESPSNDSHSPRSVERVDRGFEPGFDIPAIVHVEISTFF